MLNVENPFTLTLFTTIKNILLGSTKINLTPIVFQLTNNRTEIALPQAHTPSKFSKRIKRLTKASNLPNTRLALSTASLKTASLSSSISSPITSIETTPFKDRLISSAAILKRSSSPIKTNLRKAQFVCIKHNSIFFSLIKYKDKDAARTYRQPRWAKWRAMLMETSSPLEVSKSFFTGFAIFTV
ncbi:ADP-ribosylation factor GTPase-activating protein AGD4 [Striga asiatica]|uniref:ADP-ribosylation factor GTPase-activating protein AGD4 n=1 Tax=Striga asiatica TaxID=4170 RepID=A0A5A7QPI4_STRAF|nr:ADP-ribosylation factor GTPase-activating protein AGD4 [Striga asiatica]